ncbi:peptidylprolyl isomerase [Aquabacterium humicola]|uniref:peptidylprolyl isomerase n=1 Tax=Aquabacterium humicola TaxID=3237377 RepID=UPI0025430C83|nr:peptidylprolyl isomerase [Rubrivivax pictus]
MSLFKLLPRLAAAGFLAASTLLVPAQATMVRFHTAYGPIDIDLYDNTAAGTVQNFLSYVRQDAYMQSFIHRHEANFVIQGGGYNWPVGNVAGYVPTGAPIVNEYSADRPNVRGTIAMAKQGGNPDSATSQWFFNLKDNTTTLGPSNNGGFTVFGQVTAPGMAVVDRIAALTVVNAGGLFPQLPVRKPWATGQTMTREHLVFIDKASELPAKASLSPSDRIFNYLEAAYPQYAAPASPASATTDGYYFRYYSATNAYVGTKDGQVWYLVPALGSQITRLGSIDELLATAQANGY